MVSEWNQLCQDKGWTWKGGRTPHPLRLCVCWGWGGEMGWWWWWRCRRQPSFEKMGRNTLGGLEETGIIWGCACPYADVQCLTERSLLYLSSTAIKQENDNTSFRNTSAMTPKSWLERKPTCVNAASWLDTCMTVSLSLEPHLLWVSI